MMTTDKKLKQAVATLGAYMKEKPASHDGERYTDKAEIMRVTGLDEGEYRRFVKVAKHYGALEKSGSWWKVKWPLYTATTNNAIQGTPKSGLSYVRQRMAEDSFARKILPVVPSDKVTGSTGVVVDKSDVPAPGSLVAANPDGTLRRAGKDDEQVIGTAVDVTVSCHAEGLTTAEVEVRCVNYQDSRLLNERVIKDLMK